MIDIQDVYPYTFDFAKSNGDTALCRASYKSNVACKEAIEAAIRNNFDGSHLNIDTAKQVIGEYGYDRVNWVLANSIQQKDYDGRFSNENKDWSKTFFIPLEKGDATLDRRCYFAVDSHPAVLDGFINQARRAYKELNLWDFSHCNTTDQLDFVGKVMVLNPTMLKDSCKSGDFQLVFCTGGFGCSPTASGRKVYGEFLADGENCQYQRDDFIGELKPEHLPSMGTSMRLTLEKLVEKVRPEKKPSIKEQLAVPAKSDRPKDISKERQER